MTLSALVNLAASDLGSRYQLTREQIISFIDLIQKIAFSKDMDAFQWWGTNLTILQELTFEAAGYTSCVDSDIGVTVTEGANTGTLRYFNNTTRKWAVETADTFPAAGAVTTSGTGAGTLTSSPQAIYRGPYSYPNLTGESATTYTDDQSVPKCRRLMGVTRIADVELMGPAPGTPLYDGYMFANGWGNASVTGWGNPFSRMQGYSERAMFDQIRDNPMFRKFTFVNEPVIDAARPYRPIYWIMPQTIENENQNDRLIIPEEWHHTCVMQGITALAGQHLYAEPASYQDLLFPILKPFWNAIIPVWERNGEASNQTSQGQP
jgi:hypothetical protein